MGEWAGILAGLISLFLIIWYFRYFKKIETISEKDMLETFKDLMSPHMVFSDCDNAEINEDARFLKKTIKYVGTHIDIYVLYFFDDFADDKPRWLDGRVSSKDGTDVVRIREIPVQLLAHCIVERYLIDRDVDPLISIEERCRIFESRISNIYKDINPYKEAREEVDFDIQILWNGDDESWTKVQDLLSSIAAIKIPKARRYILSPTYSWLAVPPLMDNV